MVQFWGRDRLLLADEGRWRLLSWPALEELAAGEGRPAPEPGGDRMAVLDPGGAVRILDGPSVHVPAKAGGIVGLGWDGSGGLVAVTGSPAIDPPRVPGPSLLAVPKDGPTGQRAGSYPEEGMALWRLPLDGEGPPVRLAGFSGIERIKDPQPVVGGVVVDCYHYSWGSSPAPGRRLLRLPSGGGEPEDLFERLPGATCGLAASPDGDQLAFLHDPDEPVFPFFYRLALTDGDTGAVSYPLPDALRLAGPPTWSPDGRFVAVRAFEGIRTGAVVADLAAGRWRWLIPPEGGVGHFALAAGGEQAVAVWQPVQPPATGLYRWGPAGRVRLGRFDEHPGDNAEGGGIHRELVCWSTHGADLEGLLATPAGTGTSGEPLPVVVDLHGGPVNALSLLSAGTAVPVDKWCQAGFAVFTPEFRGSGIAGREAMDAALRGDVEDPTGGSDVADVLAGTRALVDAGRADPDRLFVFGHSYGGKLVNRLVAGEHPFQAAVCYEGEADRRLSYLLAGGGGGSPLIRALMGGTPWQVPDRYEAQSAITHVADIDTPVLLLYGEDHTTQALCWYTALRDHGVEVDLIIYRDEGHLFERPANRRDVLDRSVDWFHRHTPPPPARPPSHGAAMGERR